MKTNNIDYDIMRVRDFKFLEGPSWFGDFLQDANKVHFIFKIVYTKTLTQI